MAYNTEMMTSTEVSTEAINDNYFDTAYYFNFNVGSWNQPHIQSS